LPAAAGALAVVTLAWVLDPVCVARAVERFQLGLLPAIAILWLAVYPLQGVRWHHLLASAGVRLRLRDSVLLNAAGQTVTALMPLGDLALALFAAQASGEQFGAAAATVTVQELGYTLMLVLLALPVLFNVHLGVLAVLLTLAGIVAVVVILTVSPVFRAVHRLVAKTLLNRLMPAIDELQHETAELLHRPDTLEWSLLDLARAVAAVTAFLLVVQGLTPGSLDWWKVAFVLCLSNIAGSVSLIPGGVGANEAGMVGLLVLFGVDPSTTGAAALVQRVISAGAAIVFGLTAYGLARRRFRLGGVFQITSWPSETGPATRGHAPGASGPC
jgi:uncharacterized membrane protein YbhN (UPF0104 family)